MLCNHHYYLLPISHRTVHCYEVGQDDLRERRQNHTSDLGPAVRDSVCSSVRWGGYTCAEIMENVCVASRGSSVRGPAVTQCLTGVQPPNPAKALTGHDAKSARPRAAEHVGDALAEVVREGALLEGRQAIGDHMPHAGQIPKRAAHGRGGVCKTRVDGRLPQSRDAPSWTQDALPRAPHPSPPRRRPHPPTDSHYRAPGLHSRAGVTSPSTVAGTSGLRPSLPLGLEAAPGSREVTSGEYHFPTVSRGRRRCCLF